jgi:hypothetical protein
VDGCAEQSTRLSDEAFTQGNNMSYTLVEAEEVTTGQGYLKQNLNRRKDKDPDYVGMIMHGALPIQISAWERKDGSLSISTRTMTQAQSRKIQGV